uniref:Uncharacterized protein n=1 Tax=Picea glauca TaxID=3330 RepID=A0A124GMK0_PICGL|nr:hypothetical protein ABT39_MTgene2260 [Picea glauca]
MSASGPHLYGFESTSSGRITIFFFTGACHFWKVISPLGVCPYFTLPQAHRGAGLHARYSLFRARERPANSLYIASQWARELDCQGAREIDLYRLLPSVAKLNVISSNSPSFVEKQGGVGQLSREDEAGTHNELVMW